MSSDDEVERLLAELEAEGDEYTKRLAADWRQLYNELRAMEGIIND